MTHAVKRINVALQGGGAHGAYTWGVLDRLLDDERIEIEAISGTSAGAMNGIVVAEGLAEGGRTQARAQLEGLWRAVSIQSMGGTGEQPFWRAMVAGWQPDFNPAAAFFEMWSRVISPYQSNPLNLNPLRSLLVEQVDFARVRACKKMQLFVTATNVHTGRERIFSGRELTVDAVLASACLPHIFQAVEIDGVPYWDGGFVGNPSILPFVDSCASRDVLLVQINPIERRGTPRTAREILDRMNEISFNAPLLKELIQIDFVNTHVRDGRLADHGYREIFLHRIGGGPELAAFQATSKFNVDLAFLTRLRDLGRADADTWLRQHYSDLGQRGTLDVQHLTGRLLAKTHAT